MNEQREHPRYITKIKVEFENCGDESPPSGGEYSPSCAGFGHTLDISLGGVLMTCGSGTRINEPVSLCFYLSGGQTQSDEIRFLTRGTVVRTGKIRDIPESLRERLSDEYNDSTDVMAVKFLNPLFELSSLLSVSE